MATTQTQYLRCTAPTDLMACESLRTLNTLSPSNSFDGPSARATTSPSDGTDSGYATLTNTPNDAVKANQPTFTISASFPKRLFKKKIVLREYEHLEISDVEWARFRDLQRLIFGRPLFEYIADKRPELLHHQKGQLLECSFRLVMLGEDEESVTSRILIQCDKIVAKTVRQYFCQPNIREQYESREDNNLFPSFKLHVFDRAPAKKAATEPICIGLSYNCLYDPGGILVKVESDVGARYATIGGAVEITSNDGSVKKWNLTVGHVFNEHLTDDSHLAPSYPAREAVTESEPTPSFGDNEHCCSDDVGQKGDDGMDSETQFVLEEDSTSLERLADLSLPGFQKSTQALAVTAGHGVPLSHRSHDWAIIDTPHVSPCPFGRPSRGPCTASRQTRQVIFYSGTRGTQIGILSTRPTFVMSGVDGAVVENYTLRLRDRLATRPGDCGSWVVDAHDAVVYGYVVASDALGDVYVMPADAVLLDIKSALGARHVNLHQLPELSHSISLPEMRAHTAIHEHASVTVMQSGTQCGSTNEITYTQDRSLDSGYGTATTTPQASVPNQDADTGSLTSVGSYTSDRYEVFDRPSIPDPPPLLPNHEVTSNSSSRHTSPYVFSLSPPSEVIVAREPQVTVDREPEVVLDEEPEATGPSIISKDKGQPRSPQPSRWQTTKNAVSRFKRIFRTGNNGSKSDNKAAKQDGIRKGAVP